MSVKPQVVGATMDPRLAYLLEQVKLGVETFTEAVRSSSDNHVAVSFRAFTLKTHRKEAEAVFDIIMTAVAIELKEQSEDLIKIYTFFHSIEDGEGEYHLFLHCRKVATPTKAEVDEMVRQEEAAAEAKAAAEAAAEAAEAEKPTLPHASAIHLHNEKTYQDLLSSNAKGEHLEAMLCG
jgi:hypothetical protein